MIPRSFLFIFSTLILSLVSVIAQEPSDYIIDSGKESQIVSASHFLLIQSDTSFNFPTDTAKFRNPASCNFSKIPPNGSYMVKLTLKNPTDSTFNAVLLLGKKRSTDMVKVLVTNTFGFTESYTTGYFEKKSVKPIKQDVETKIPVYLLAGQSKTYYVYAKNISGFSPTFEPVVYSKQHFFNKITLRNWIQGLIQGALIIMFLYNLFLFLFSRDRTYLYYALYILTLAQNFVSEKGLFIEFMIPEFPVLNPYVFAFTANFGMVFYVMFMRKFLNTKTNNPVWDIAHRAVIALNISILAIEYIYLALSFNIAAVVNFNNILNLIELVYGLAFMLVIFKARNRIAYYFIAGTVALVTGTFISIFFLITKANIGFDPKYFMNIGILTELLIFSLGLGYRIRKTEKEKQQAQESLIDQLQQNEELQLKHNRELEGKVKARTAEIEQQKEEITAQRDEIVRQRDLATMQRDQIFKQNCKMTDSITYAQRIQKAMLPSTNLLKSIFNNHFVLYKPRDIVSGDFYQVYSQGDNTIIAVGDATGHGVPGAFMSLLGMSFLNEIYSSGAEMAAHEVLNHLRDSVKTSLGQTGAIHESKDGFDLSLCIINRNKKVLHFAGANQAMHIVRKGKLISLKPDKMPIGVYYKEKSSFTTQTHQLKPNDMLYLYTDGYIDQFGGPNERKFLRTNFKDLIVRCHTESADKQFSMLQKTMENWQGNENPQIDDILVVGIRI